MKNVLMLLACCMLGCQQPIATKKSSVTVERPHESTINASVHHVCEKFDLGDIDGDGTKDRATVQFDFNFDTNDVVCDTPNCYINIGFGAGIPDLDLDQSLGIFVRSAPDLDGDNRDDILLFSRTYEGSWNAIFAYGFSDGQWMELARTKCFFSDDTDAENRFVKDKNGYCLVGDQWNDSKGGVVKRSVKVKIAWQKR